MRKIIVFALFLPILWSCDSSSYPPSKNPDEPQTQEKDQKDSPNQETGLNENEIESAQLANAYCANQKQLQILSTGLQSAYHLKGNGSDKNSCGGEIALNPVGSNFDIVIKDYCVIAGNQQITVNGVINGATESGANFTSEIPNLAITGDEVDLSISGRTWDGRADDMFMSLTITDNINNTLIILEDVSIKKGKFDFGFFAFEELDRVEFKFIEHFNPDLTDGRLFIYGVNEELLIITADQGTITVVYKDSKLDSGTLIDSNC